MQQMLRQNLITAAVAFAEARKVKLSTLGRLAANDAPFFMRLQDENKTFTAKKYDDVMAWLSANWPDSAIWPAGVSRPNAACSPASDSTAGHSGGSYRLPTAETGSARGDALAPPDSVRGDAA